MLEATELGKEFQRRGAVFAAVSGVNLSLAPGEFATITGTSGSGKTTLVTMLAGLATPTSGSVRFQGKDMYRLPDKELSHLRNSGISFIPQGMGLLGNLTVFDNVRSPQMFAGKNGPASDRADFLLEAVGLRDLAQEYPHSLSGGEIRRVSIARALFSEPAVLIADEPTSDLDPENTRLIMELLDNAKQLGTALIVVTHDAKVAARGRTRYTMTQGRLGRDDEKL